MKKKDYLILGFALFSMFGAGNLIFPPTLGLMAGENWLGALLGFLTHHHLKPYDQYPYHSAQVN